MIKRREFIAGVGAMLAARHLSASQAPLEVAYVNAKLWTGRPRPKPATAFGTIGNRIAAVGENADIRAMCGKSTRVIDLDGAFVLPGFMDNHTHFLRASFKLAMPELRTAKDDVPNGERGLARSVRQRRLPPLQEAAHRGLALETDRDLVGASRIPVRACPGQ